MAALKNILAYSVYPLIFACWTGFFVYLLTDKRYTAFLRPEFGLLLFVALTVSFAFFIATVTKYQKIHDLSALLRGTILLVPIAYFAAMSDTTLGNQAFKKRFTGINVKTKNSARSAFSPPNKYEQTEEEFLAEIGLLPPPNSLPTEELTIFDILINPTVYEEKEVILIGMFIRDPQLKDYLNGRETALYRFLINCCAADAVPLAIGLDAGPEHIFPKNQWVQVKGRLTLQEINGNLLPILKTPQIKTVSPPKNPFLY